MSKVSNGLKWAVVLLVTASAAGGAWWATRPEPPAPDVEVADADAADPSREETEDLMRQIGYVQ